MEEAQLSPVILDVNKVHEDPGQPRKNFDEQHIAELGLSIRMAGQTNPIEVYQTSEAYGEVPAGDYIIAAGGANRLRAIKAESSLSTIRAFVIDEPVTEAARREIYERQMADNVHKAFDPMEAVEAVARAIEMGTPIFNAGAKVGKSAPWVRAHLPLVGLPAFIKKALDHREISLEVGRKLAEFSDKTVVTAYKWAVAEGNPDKTKLRKRQLKHTSKAMLNGIEAYVSHVGQQETGVGDSSDYQEILKDAQQTGILKEMRKSYDTMVKSLYRFCDKLDGKADVLIVAKARVHGAMRTELKEMARVATTLTETIDHFAANEGDWGVEDVVVVRKAPEVVEERKAA